MMTFSLRASPIMWGSFRGTLYFLYPYTSGFGQYAVDRRSLLSANTVLAIAYHYSQMHVIMTSKMICYYVLAKCIENCEGTPF